MPHLTPTVHVYGGGIAGAPFYCKRHAVEDEPWRSSAAMILAANPKADVLNCASL
jgi:hypothetical protein